MITQEREAATCAAVHGRIDDTDAIVAEFDHALRHGLLSALPLPALGPRLMSPTEMLRSSHELSLAAMRAERMLVEGEPSLDAAAILDTAWIEFFERAATMPLLEMK